MEKEQAIKFKSKSIFFIVKDVNQEKLVYLGIQLLRLIDIIHKGKLKKINSAIKILEFKRSWKNNYETAWYAELNAIKVA